MNHVTRQFQQRLAAFRTMDDKRRSTVCDVMKISQKTHLRMLAAIRAETGTLTKAERFREIVAMVRDWIGDGDPHLVSGVTIAKAVGCSEGQANRARQAIMRKRVQPVTAPKAAWPAEPKPPKPAKLFWTIGDRLFCEHRQPQEVGS